MESYVTYIGHRLGTQFGGEDICKIPPDIDDKTLHASHFIRISRQLTRRGARYYWVFADMPERELPIHSSISFGDDRTWRLEYIMGAPADIPPRRPFAPPMDATMEDVPSSSAPGPSHVAISHPTPDPYMQGILQHLQGISLCQHEDKEYYSTRFDAIDGQLDSLSTEIGSLRSEV
jgi:hypothetical protein